MRERFVDTNGYVRVHRPEHPQAMYQGFVYEHRLVAEGMLGRSLSPDETVVHLDGNRTNNAPENLRILTRSEMMRERQAETPNAGWSRSEPCCTHCGRTDRPPGTEKLCESCYSNELQKAKRKAAGRYTKEQLAAAWGYSRKENQVYAACRDCGRNDRKHQTGGLCSSCYSFRRHHQIPFTGPLPDAATPAQPTGEYVDARGYLRVHQPSHPQAMDGGYVYAHRLVMEKLLGRQLTDDEVIHHRDHNPLNNDPANLLLTDPAEHARIHRAEERGTRWSRTRDACTDCGTSEIPNWTDELCARCYHRERKRRINNTPEDSFRV